MKITYLLGVGIFCLIIIASLVFPRFTTQAAEGNIRNLNFGITNSFAWFQCIGSDCRIDGGFADPVAATATPACGGPNASVQGPQSSTPGVVYTGDSKEQLGGGNSNVNNWLVGGQLYPEVFTPVNAGVGRTSYNYFTTIINQSSITPTDLQSVASCSNLANCDLSGLAAPGVYKANGSVTLVNPKYTFPPVAFGRGFVILVNGDLTIKGNILVPFNSHALFSASGNIIIDRSVGVSSQTTSCVTTDPTQPGCNIEGLYSADKNIIIDGASACPTPDKRLNIAGTIVANAAFKGGGVLNKRDLCVGNLSCPSYTISERPDFILNAPSFLKHPTFVWQEAAP